MLFTSGFVDDVMFSHNGANEPESNTMLFHRVQQVVALGGGKFLSKIAGLLKFAMCIVKYCVRQAPRSARLQVRIL